MTDEREAPPPLPSEERQDLTLEQLRLEREKFQAERDARLMELELRAQEIARQHRWSPLVIAIFTAAAAGVGNLGVSYLNGRSQAQIETMRSEQALVLEAIKTGGDVKKASTNLTFLAKSGLLGDRAQAIMRALKAGDRPGLPAGSVMGTGGGGPDVEPASGSQDGLSPACLEAVHLRVPGESYGSQVTRTVIRSFQKKHGLAITGSYNAETLARARAICDLSED